MSKIETYSINDWHAAVKKHHPDAEIVSHPADESGNQHTYAMYKTKGQADKNKIVAKHTEYADGDEAGYVKTDTQHTNESIDQLDELSNQKIGAVSMKRSNQFMSAKMSGDHEKAKEYKEKAEKAGKRLRDQIPAKESVEAFVSAILDGDEETATSAFNQAMGEKLTHSIDAMKIEIASTISK